MLDFAVLTGITAGITQLLKNFVDSKYVALCSVLVATILGGVYGYSQHADLIQSLVVGLVAGLSASGLYDATTHPFTK